jgi:AraC-like DNA-binding protein
MSTGSRLPTRPGIASWNISADDDPRVYDFYRNGMADWYAVSDVEDPASRTFFTQNTVCQFGDFVVGRGRSVAQTLSRGDAEVRRSGMDNLVLLLDLAGLKGDIDGVNVSAAPGTIHFRDLSRVSTAHVPAVDVVTLMLPRETAPRWLTERRCHGLTIDNSGPLGGLLINHLVSLGHAAPRMGADEGVAAIEAALILAESALVSSNRLATNDNQAAYRSLRTDAARLIDRELFNPDLSVEHLMAALGVSRTTLFRAFTESGGVNHYIKQRRLQKARVALLRRVGHRPTIEEIAHEHGFVSGAHFSRSFRDFFGEAPGATHSDPVAAPPCGTPDEAMRYDLVLSWMKGGRSRPE